MNAIETLAAAIHDHFVTLGGTTNDIEKITQSVEAEIDHVFTDEEMGDALRAAQQQFTKA